MSSRSPRSGDRATRAGIGYAARRVADGSTVAVLAAANSVGDVIAADGQVIGGPRGDSGELLRSAELIAGLSDLSNSLQADNNSSIGHFLFIGISSLRSSSFGAASEIARRGRSAIVASSRIRGTMPAVEIVMRLGNM